MSEKLIVEVYAVDDAGNKEPVGVMNVPAKDFKTGSKGFFTSGKLDVDGFRYQTQVQLVLIGSKPVTPEVVARKADARVERAAAALAKAKADKAAAVAALKGSAKEEPKA